MTVAVHLPDELAARLAEAASDRGLGIDEVAAEIVSAGLPERIPVSAQPVRSLAFFAVGESKDGRGAARADEILAEGFGRD